jgi:DNA-binding MarR family transcriptional regulator
VTEAQSPAAAPDVRRETADHLRIAIGAFKRRAREAGTGDLTTPQLAALSRLDRCGPMTTTALARREQITPQAMGATVAGLEKLGLVTRSAYATDARQSILSLTPEGLAAVRSGRDAVVDRVTAVLAESFGDAEVEVLSAAAPLIERLAELL